MPNAVTGGDNPSSGHSGPKAPSSWSNGQGFNRKAKQLETTSVPNQLYVECDDTSAVTPSVDNRILPDVGTSIWCFTGHESSNQVEDWNSSVDGLAQVNQWPLPYRLLYVWSHVTEAARSWYLFEEFRDWDTYVRSFRRTFTRTLRKADLWRDLKTRVEDQNEPTIYFYAKIGLCHLLDLTFAKKREYVLEGLRSQPLTDWVYGHTHFDRDNLLTDIRDWECIRAKRKDKSESVNPTTTKARKLNRNVRQNR